MRIAFISDIHANMEAFTQVLGDIDASDIDAVYCLGDVVGYGPEPNQVIEIICDRGIPTVIGNHELAVMDAGYLKLFNRFARDSLRKTIRLLSRDSMAFIRSLEPYMVVSDCRLVHGFPPDSPMTYISYVSEAEIRAAFVQLEETLCCIGHTHELGIVSFHNDTITPARLSQGVTPLYAENRYILNVGSVGQPRDGNNSAKYVIWDTATDTIDVRYIPYDIDSVAKKIIEAGLPVAHAKRLR